MLRRGVVALWMLAQGIFLVPAGALASAASKPTAPTPHWLQTGIASWYRTKRPLTAAHRTLPRGTKVRVRARSGRFVTVTITGRGPFVKGRVIDLSADAFQKLASLGTGLIHVRLESVQRASADAHARIRSTVRVRVRQQGSTVRTAASGEGG